MRSLKDIYLILAGFCILMVIMFIQNAELSYRLFFHRPLAIAVLSIFCFVFETLDGKNLSLSDENSGIEKHPE